MLTRNAEVIVENASSVSCARINTSFYRALLFKQLIECQELTGSSKKVSLFSSPIIHLDVDRSLTIHFITVKRKRVLICSGDRWENYSFLIDVREQNSVASSLSLSLRSNLTPSTCLFCSSRCLRENNRFLFFFCANTDKHLVIVWGRQKVRFFLLLLLFYLWHQLVASERILNQSVLPRARNNTPSQVNIDSNRWTFVQIDSGFSSAFLRSCSSCRSLAASRVNCWKTQTMPGRKGGPVARVNFYNHMYQGGSRAGVRKHTNDHFYRSAFF